MAMIQSVSPIESAARSERNWLFILAAWIVISALVTGVLTVLLYKKTGKYQETVKVDADARIAEAGTKAATANERAAVANAEAAKANEGLAKSNEEIARLTREAEKAKTERAEADKQIAIAKADAARAKEGIANAEATSAKASVEVARLQVIVANAEKQRAEAERALLELKEQVKHRHLTLEQRANLLAILKAGPKGKVTFEIFVGDHEAGDFLDEMAAVLGQAGWELVPGSQSTEAPPKGLGLFVHSATEPPFGGFLQRALRQIGLDAQLLLSQIAQEIS